MKRILKCFSYDFERGLGERYKNAKGFPPNFIFDFFTLNFKKTDSVEVEKLIIKYTDDEDENLCCKQLSNVLLVNYYFDLDRFQHSDIATGKKIFLDSILRSYLMFSEKFGWNRENCQKTYQQILDASIEFKGNWKRPVKNPWGTVSAMLYFEYFEEICIKIIIIDKKNNLIAENIITKLPPSWAAFVDIVGGVCWINEYTVRLLRSNKKDYWDYNIKNYTVEFYFDRAEKGDPHGQFDLGVMYLEGKFILPDKEKAIFWLKKSASQNYAKSRKLLMNIKNI